MFFLFSSALNAFARNNGAILFEPINLTAEYQEVVFGEYSNFDYSNLLSGGWIEFEGMSSWLPIYFGQGIDPDIDEPAELELANVYNITLREGEVSWEMMTKNHVQYPEGHPCWLPSGAPYWGEWSGYYSHASMNVFFAGPTVGYYLTYDSEITVSWESNEDLRLILGDTHVYDEIDCFTGRNRTSTSMGAGYRVTLPAGMHTRTFRMSDFRQPNIGSPDWFSPQYVYELDVNKVEMLSFSAIAPSGQIQPPNTIVKTTNVRLTQLEVKGVEWRCCE